MFSYKPLKELKTKVPESFGDLGRGLRIGVGDTNCTNCHKVHSFELPTQDSGNRSVRIRELRVLIEMAVQGTAFELVEESKNAHALAGECGS